MRVEPASGRAPAPKRTVPCNADGLAAHAGAPALGGGPARVPVRPAGAAVPYSRQRGLDACSSWSLAASSADARLPPRRRGWRPLLAAASGPVFFRVDAQMRLRLRDARRRARRAAARSTHHYAGFPRTWSARQLANELGVPLIEDCALALLSRKETTTRVGRRLFPFCLYKTCRAQRGRVPRARRFRDELHRLAEIDPPAGRPPRRTSPAPALEPGKLRGPSGAQVTRTVRGEALWVPQDQRLSAS